MSTKPVAKHGHIGLLIIESKSNQLKSGKSTGSEIKSGKSVFKDLKSGNSVFKEELKSGKGLLLEDLKSSKGALKEDLKSSKFAVREDLKSNKFALKDDLKSGKVLLLEDLKSSKGALKEDLKSGKVAWFDEIIMEAAEEMLSPLFTMPPSSACFYRVSSSLTNSPSVYDKLKTWLNQKSVEEPEVNTLLTSTPTREGNPILKSVENVRMLNRADVRKPFIGTLNLNTSALIFQDRDCKKETWVGT
uniref:MTMR6-9 GRAM domain-containing protein n=1 Tax=Cacopsylla melanoneura TaxID=428564 RepID=A0A8D9FD48_9HEMI